MLRESKTAHGEDVLSRTDRTIITTGVIGGVALIAGLTYLLFFHNAWERKHRFEIEQLASRIVQLGQTGEIDKAQKVVDELTALLGDKVISDRALRADVDRALALVATVQEERRKLAEAERDRIEAERRTAEARRQDEIRQNAAVEAEGKRLLLENAQLRQAWVATLESRVRRAASDLDQLWAERRKCPNLTREVNSIASGIANGYVSVETGVNELAFLNATMVVVKQMTGNPEPLPQLRGWSVDDDSATVTSLAARKDWDGLAGLLAHRYFCAVSLQDREAGESSFGLRLRQQQSSVASAEGRRLIAEMRERFVQYRLEEGRRAEQTYRRLVEALPAECVKSVDPRQ